MSVVWEEPPPRPGIAGRQRSPERILCDDAKLELAKYPGRWARLFDMDDKDEARKRASILAEKGFRFAVRATEPNVWSVFGLCKPFVPEEPSPSDTATDGPVTSSFQ